MFQMSEFLGSSSVLKVQVTSQGQRFFLEHVDQGLRGGRGQLEGSVLVMYSTQCYIQWM